MQTVMNPSSPGVFTKFSGVLHHRIVARLTPAAALLGCVGLAAVWKPSDKEHVICVFRLATGHWCPGCGMTRGVLALFRGHLSTSFGYHPLAIVLVAQAIVFAVWRLAGKGPLTGNLRRQVFATNIIALLVVFAYRSTFGSFPAPGSLAG